MPPCNRHLLILLLLTTALAGCSSVEPQGALKSVMEGSIFDHTPANPAEEKKKEDDQRQLNRQIPPPKEDQGAVNFKIPL